MTDRKIRVLTLIESPTVTGPARNIIEFGKLAAEPEGDLPAVEVLVATYWRGEDQSPVTQIARQAGLASFTLRERRRWDTAVIGQLRSLISREQPDILESRNVKSHFLVRMLRLHHERPWVAWNHGYTARDWLDRSYNQLDRWSLRGAHRVITVCEPFAQRLAAQGIESDRITILHNCVKPFVAASEEEVERARIELRLEDELVILSIGRLSSEKAHADLIRAADLLKKKADVPRFKVVIVGDGPEQRKLERLMNDLNLRDSVALTGFQSRVSPYYSLATLFALPSVSEGSPNVVLEAMAAGVPLVATRVGGVPGILEHDVTGLLLEPSHPEKMAETLKRLMLDKCLRERLAAAARLRAQRDFAPSAYRRKLTEFYQGILQSN